MSSVYKREIRSFFTTVIGWVFIAAMLFVTGLYFTVYNIIQAYPYVAYSLQGAIFLFLIAMPILSMRILSEDKKQKTDQLILTAPVSVRAIVFGKYLAMVTVFAISAIAVCVYPVVMSAYGTVDMGQAYASIFGYFLYGLACIKTFFTDWNMQPSSILLQPCQATRHWQLKPHVLPLLGQASVKMNKNT